MPPPSPPPPMLDEGEVEGEGRGEEEEETVGLEGVAWEVQEREGEGVEDGVR